MDSSTGFILSAAVIVFVLVVLAVFVIGSTRNKGK